MRYPLPPLPALHAFEAAARRGSFTAAAEELHLATSTVSHRVRELEAHLGAALFERLPRSLRLTDLGKAYLPVVRAVFDELTRATVGLFGAPGRGRVTVRVPISYGVAFLAPRIDELSARHDVRVWVVSAIWGDEAPDLEIDLEVEFEDERLAAGGAETLGREEAVLVASPGTVPRRPSAAGAGGWSRVLVLGYDKLWQQLDPAPPPGASEQADVTVDTWSAAIEMAASGPGRAAMVPALLASGALDDGRLVRLDHPPVPMRETYRLLRPDTAAPPSADTEAFVAWLRAQHGRDPHIDSADGRRR